MNKTDMNSQFCGISESAGPAFPVVGEKNVWHAPVLTVADCDETETSSGGSSDSGILS